MDAVRTYDSKECNLVIGGVVVTGHAEGTWITAERAEDDFSTHVGAHGEVAIAETNNDTGEIKFTLEVTSPSNKYLYELSKRRGSNAIISATIVDANESGGIRISAEQSRVRRPANYTSGPEITQREWTLFCASLEFSE
jgi:hypothetical protein